MKKLTAKRGDHARGWYLTDENKKKMCQPPSLGLVPIR